MKWSFVYLIVSLTSFAQPIVAASDEQDSALQACRAGQVAGLPCILSRAHRAYTGRVLAVELTRSQAGAAAGPWVYMVKMLTPPGQCHHALSQRQDHRHPIRQGTRRRGRAPAPMSRPMSGRPG